MTYQTVSPSPISASTSSTAILCTPLFSGPHSSCCLTNMLSCPVQDHWPFTRDDILKPDHGAPEYVSRRERVVTAESRAAVILIPQNVVSRLLPPLFITRSHHIDFHSHPTSYLDGLYWSLCSILCHSSPIPAAFLMNTTRERHWSLFRPTYCHNLRYHVQ